MSINNKNTAEEESSFFYDEMMINSNIFYIGYIFIRI